MRWWHAAKFGMFIHWGLYSIPGQGDGGGERQIEAVNRALLARHALGEVREFTVKGWNGEPVQMFVTYPPHFDARKKWPLRGSEIDTCPQLTERA